MGFWKYFGDTLKLGAYIKCNLFCAYSEIDKVVWTTDEDKSKAIEKLDTLKYHA